MEREIGHICSLCSINHATEKHHLIPVEVKNNGQISRKVRMCRKCHRFIHKAFTNEELGLELNIIEKLRSHPLVQQFLELMETEVQFSIRKVKIDGNTIICKRDGKVIFKGGIFQR